MLHLILVPFLKVRAPCRVERVSLGFDFAMAADRYVVSLDQLHERYGAIVIRHLRAKHPIPRSLANEIAILHPGQRLILTKSHSVARLLLMRVRFSADCGSGTRWHRVSVRDVC